MTAGRRAATGARPAGSAALAVLLALAAGAALTIAGFSGAILSIYHRKD